MAVLQANLSRGSARSMTTQAVKHDARLDSDAPDSLSRRTPYISHLDSNTASLVLSLLPAHLPFLPSHLQDGKILLVPPKPQNILPHFLLLLLTSPSQPNLDASPLVYTLSLSQAGHLSNLLGSTRTLWSPPDSPISSPVPRRARCTAGQAVLGKGVEPRQERSQSDRVSKTPRGMRPGVEQSRMGHSQPRPLKEPQPQIRSVRVELSRIPRSPGSISRDCGGEHPQETNRTGT